MKAGKYMLVAAALVLALTPGVRAAEQQEDMARQYGVDLEQVGDALPGGVSLEDYAAQGDLGGGLAALWQENKDAVSSVAASALGDLGQAFFSLALCAVASGLVSGGGAETVAVRAVSAAGAVALTVAFSSGVSGVLGLCRDTLDQLDIFSKSLLPVMAGAVTCSGAGSAGAVAYGVTVMALDGLVTLVDRLLLPMMSGYLLLCGVCCAVGGGLLEQVAHWLKWAMSAALKALVGAFVAYLTISGTMAGQAAGAVIKTGKAAVSGAVPVVGRILSDATESFLGGAALVKNAVGLLGMLGVISICLLPVLHLAVNCLVFRLGAAVLSPLQAQGLHRLVERYADAYALVLGMVCSCAAIVFFEMVFCIMLAVPS